VVPTVQLNLLSRAKNSGRQCHFKIKNISLSDYAHVNKVLKKMTITVIQHVMIGYDIYVKV
jgi:uncharacterized radical SAM superfamily protein